MAVTENVFLPIGSAGGPASGSTDFTFTFEYLNKNTDIKVSLDGVNTSAYTFPTGSVVRFNTAPADGVVVRIYRDTDIDTARAVFAPGSVIRAQDLNDNFEQIRFVTQETDNNTWDNETETVKSTNTWVSSDEKVATTAAIDARFQDEIGDTLISSEAWVSSDDYIATTRSIDQRIDTAITNDIGTDGTGITVTDDGDGTITLGLADNTIDFSKIKDEDIITYAEQEAGSPSWLSDTRIPTTFAAARRFDTIVQTTTPVGINWEVGKTWLQNDQDLTLSIWNGTNWLAIASGGAFINQPKVVYVDASSGDDANDGHRISRPKRTVKAAINQINADAIYGDGSVVVVAPGTYQEVAPIDITKKDVSIIGTALRSCVIHPTPATETNSLFRVNSGTFLQNLTFTGVKASGTRGEVGSVDPDPVYGLPGTQGWNVSFYPGAMIYKSPYIQNCTNFSDSEIDNGSLNPHTPAGGAAGDTDSAMTGGGLLVDGSTVNASSPLRSMVCDSYTHVGLDGPGILVTNNGYAQCTSSYAFFNHYHIKALNGGQANLAASTTDFGRYGLVVDGRSTNAIFTATTTVDANSGDISFTIGTPVAGSPWHGSATRPQSNMLVDIGGNTYPILSATPNGAGWDVVISRPNPSDRSQNLGLNGAVLTGATVEFYLRSMIASSGHTMEYVGSGTNYAALPENGGVPVEANQVVELNNGKIWTATTDHNGKFKVGDFFTVDQQTNAIYISSGSFNVDLQNLQVNPSGNAVIGANLDLNGSDILDSTGNVTIADTLDMNSNAIINVQAPTSGSDAANKTYVDTKLSLAGGTMTGALGVTAGSAASPSVFISADTNSGIYSPGADQVAISTGGAQRATIDSSGRLLVGTSTSRTVEDCGGVAVEALLQIEKAGGSSALSLIANSNSSGEHCGTLNLGRSSGTALGSNTVITTGDKVGAIVFNAADGTDIRSRAAEILCVIDGTPGSNDVPGRLVFSTTADGSSGPTERLKISSSGDLIVGSSSSTTNYIYNSNAAAKLHLSGGGGGSANIEIHGASHTTPKIITFSTDNAERLRITSDGKVGLGTSAPVGRLSVVGSAGSGEDGIQIASGSTTVGSKASLFFNPTTTPSLATGSAIKSERLSPDGSDLQFYTVSTLGNTPVRAMTIDKSQRVGIGTTNPLSTLHLNQSASGDILRLNTSSGGGQGIILGVDTTGSCTYWKNNTSSGYDMRFEVGGSEKVRIDSSGRLLVGTSSTSDNSLIQIQGRASLSTGPAEFALRKGALPSSGDTIASIKFQDNSGNLGGGITAAADANWTSGSSHGTRVTFSTTAVGAPSPTERMVLESVGNTRISNAGYLYPYTDNATYLGGGSNRWIAVYAANGTIQTSDKREKTQIVNSSLGSDFIKSLRPVSYKWIEGGKRDTGERDENGNYIYESVMGQRTHWGFIAQEVKEAVDVAGVDFGGWVLIDKDDPDSQQALRYDQFIAPLTKALQETMAELEALKAEVAALKAA